METVKLVVSIAALIISGVAIFMSRRVAIKLKNQDIANDRRRLFITALWDKLTAVRGLDSGNATRERVVEVLNTLELVALCWESNIVDKDLVTRAFGDSYSLRVAEVNGITSGKGYDDLIEELGMDGPRLLEQYARIVPVCNEIKKELSKRP